MKKLIHFLKTGHWPNTRCGSPRSRRLFRRQRKFRFPNGIPRVVVEPGPPIPMSELKLGERYGHQDALRNCDYPDHYFDQLARSDKSDPIKWGVPFPVGPFLPEEWLGTVPGAGWAIYPDDDNPGIIQSEN